MLRFAKQVQEGRNNVERTRQAVIPGSSAATVDKKKTAGAGVTSGTAIRNRTNRSESRVGQSQGSGFPFDVKIRLRRTHAIRIVFGPMDFSNHFLPVQQIAALIQRFDRLVTSHFVIPERNNSPRFASR